MYTIIHQVTACVLTFVNGYNPTNRDNNQGNELGGGQESLDSRHVTNVDAV